MVFVLVTMIYLGANETYTGACAKHKSLYTRAQLGRRIAQLGRHFPKNEVFTCMIFATN